MVFGGRRSFSQNKMSLMFQSGVAHLPFYLTSDACSTGLGALLSQEINGHEAPTAFASIPLRNMNGRPVTAFQLEVSSTI